MRAKFVNTSAFIVARSRTHTDPNVRMSSASAEGGQGTYARLTLCGWLLVYMYVHVCMCTCLYMSVCVHVCICLYVYMSKCVVLSLTGVISIKECRSDSMESPLLHSR